ncbi:MAG: aminotransferase class V-fold PLP-dependent enzyme [Ruminococcaceae bacterium]|nr:aminotransferase class V-fold PLP-dependent enzyme [Oscillospiraceae bacterium]
MKNIYLDNASTTFPKPEPVAKAVYHYMTEIGSNINRGCYAGAYTVEDLIFDTRQALTDLFHGPDCKNVVFTKNITESLNILLKGFLKPGDHVLVSSMEHNAVMRPLVQLEKAGVISFTRVPCRQDGTLIVEELKNCLQSNTRMVVMTHGSNVCGTMLPLEQVGQFCAEHGLKFFVDSAQTAGVWPVDMVAMHIDALAFTGHKGLLGPQGTGGFLLQEEMIAQIEPLLSGGTGSLSHTEDIPSFMPDRFECGTMNLPGIVGLHASLNWLQEKGIDQIRNHELALTERFIQQIREFDPQEQYIRLIGRMDTQQRTGVVSLQAVQQDQADLAHRLDAEYGIQTRVGLHCAPSAHKTLNTYPTGTVRFSFGWNNTPEEIDTAVQALIRLTRGV